MLDLKRAYTYVVFIVIGLSYALVPCVNAMSPLVHRFPSHGPLELGYRDYINLPEYTWPRTLVDWWIDFRAVRATSQTLQVINKETGKPVDFQLSNVVRSHGVLQFAKLWLFTSLKSGGQFQYEVKIGSRHGAVPDLPVRTAGHSIDVMAGRLILRIPSSQAFASGLSEQNIPGPIEAICLHNSLRNQWFGRGELISPTDRVLSIHTTAVSRGPLFQQWRVDYRFANGGQYVVQVRAPLAYPFIELRENMENIPLNKHVKFIIPWTHLKVNMREGANGSYVPLRIDKPIITPGTVEDPRWDPGFIENPTKKMYYQLAPFSGNAIREAVPAIDFWNQAAGGLDIGLFALHARRWNDHQYMLWQPSTRLRVRFRYRDQTLSYIFPVVSGFRDTAINLGHWQTDMSQLSDMARSAGNFPLRGSNAAVLPELTKIPYSQYLYGIYGELSLNNVKNWVLDYPKSLKEPDDVLHNTGGYKSVSQFVHAVRTCATLTHYPFGPDIAVLNISHRVVYDKLIPGYLHYQNLLTTKQRQEVDALFLLCAYMNSGDEMAPTRCCLSGPPNMSADGFSMLADMAMLFPEHPMAGTWLEQFHKAMQLMDLFYTRPTVQAYQSHGGRWAESIAVYNWAFMRPTEIGNLCGTMTDGVNCIADPWSAMKGWWLVNDVTAPIYNPNPGWREPFSRQPPMDKKFAPPSVAASGWRPGMPLSYKYGFTRQYPAWGAHATSGTALLIPPYVWLFGNQLHHYAPMVAEHLMWLARHAYNEKTWYDRGEVNDAWMRAAIQRYAFNDGTRPELKSCKITGQGYVLRAGVGGPHEVSLFLDQVDRGPNYRWGDNAVDSSGSIWLQAGGRIFTGDDRESTGDHSLDDTDGFSTFGVWKRGKYRAIGMNVLNRPLDNLGFAQFAALDSRKGPHSYVWPQYVSRSVMLVGTDYAVIYDRMGTPGTGKAPQGTYRFTWFNARDLPFPDLIFLQPMVERTDHWSEVTTPIARGVWRDQDRGPDSLVLVPLRRQGVNMVGMSHQTLPFLRNLHLQQYRWQRGGKLGHGVYRVQTPHSLDTFFRASAPIIFNHDGLAFVGRAGVIRRRTNNDTQLALFKGSVIAADGLQIKLAPASGVAVGLTITPDFDCRGIYVASQGAAEVEFTLPGNIKPADEHIYIDGAVIASRISGHTVTVTLPAGRHHIEISAGHAIPMAPHILKTVNISGGAKVFITPVASAASYELSIALDGSHDWHIAKKSAAPSFVLSGLTNGKKYHLKVDAQNAAGKAGPSSPQYPLYVSGRPLPPPDGLMIWRVQPHQVDLSWGKVLGVGQYRLYRRRLGNKTFRLVYSGPNNWYADAVATELPPVAQLPGVQDNPLYKKTATVVYQYAVACMNGNGEGPMSNMVSTNPIGWQVWWPDVPLQYRRFTAYWMPPYRPIWELPPAYYPGQLNPEPDFSESGNGLH